MSETMEEPTLEQVRYAAREVVEEFGPDTVYRERFGDDEYPNHLGELQSLRSSAFPEDDNVCMYRRPDGSPSCIAAQIWHRLGGDVGALKENVPFESQMAVEFWDDATRVYVGQLQRCQDDGDSWGSAFLFAEASIP